MGSKRIYHDDDSGRNPEVLSESAPLPEGAEKRDKKNIRERLEEIRGEVTLETSDEKREELLIEALQGFLDPEEQEILASLESLEKPSENVKAYLETGGALLLAAYELKNDKPARSIRALVDEFGSKESSAPIKSYTNALVFILNNKDSEVSKWFLDEGWQKANLEARKFTIGAGVAAESLSDTVKFPPHYHWTIFYSYQLPLHEEGFRQRDLKQS